MAPAKKIISDTFDFNQESGIKQAFFINWRDYNMGQ
jgi:hypothetical protein